MRFKLLERLIIVFSIKKNWTFFFLQNDSIFWNLLKDLLICWNRLGTKYEYYATFPFLKIYDSLPSNFYILFSKFVWVLKPRSLSFAEIHYWLRPQSPSPLKAHLELLECINCDQGILIPRAQVALLHSSLRSKVKDSIGTRWVWSIRWC